MVTNLIQSDHSIVVVVVVYLLTGGGAFFNRTKSACSTRLENLGPIGT